LLEEATADVLAIDIDGARAHMSALEAAMGCGETVNADLLARFWLLEGVLQSLEDDPTAASDAFRAAQEVSADAWIQELGPGMRATYEEANAQEDASGTLILTPAEAFVAVDGHPRSTPVQVTAGLRLIQAGPRASEVTYSRIVHVTSGEPHRLELPIALDTPEPEPVAEELADVPALVDPRPEAGLGVFGGIGSGLAIGEAIQFKDERGTQREEAALKIEIPLELGAVFRFGSAGWIRAAGTLSPRLNGPYLFTAGDEIGQSVVTYGALLGAGVRTPKLEVGLLGGVAMPSRIPLRAVLSTPLGNMPLRIEARAGLNLVATRPAEPAAGLSILVQP